VDLVTTTVVGLVRALAHDCSLILISLERGGAARLSPTGPATRASAVPTGAPGGTTGTRPSAGTAHPRAPEALVDMRHPSTHRSPRMTGQRYAGPRQGVKPSPTLRTPWAPTCGELVARSCPRG
jgi:hypothetical protein